MAEVNRDASPHWQSKKRRIRGACDICKRRKVRCDSGTMPDNHCSNCVQFGFECTHREVTKALGSARCYVESLEQRLEKMDRLFNKLLPGIDVNREIEKINEDSSASAIPPAADEDASEPPTENLSVYLNKLKLNAQHHVFYGKSSGYELLQTALDLKQEYTGAATLTLSTDMKRKEFWEVPEWVTKNPEIEEKDCAYIFPDADLMPSLINAYFLEFNPFMPLLHRPTFEKSVAEGLHFSDSKFGATLLLVCANGARYSDDPRVLADGSDNLRSAGWRWFKQVNVYRPTLYKGTSLYELQMHALHVIFSRSSETPQGIWAQVGLALRLSQNVGAHRRRRKKDAPPSAVDELWKRAFWVLLSLDRGVSSQYGQPCGLNDEDFDLDLPLECDDEYWDDEFRQPPGKPSSIAFFNCYLGIMDILAYAIRLVYSIRLPDDKIVNVPPRSQQQAIAQLDSAINNWMDTVPSHLRSNPNHQNTLFLKQSALLHATYYGLQIFIHRSFIPSPRNPGPTIFPSMAICTNAARSCCHIFGSFIKSGGLPFASLQATAFYSGVILLLNIWSGKRSGYAPNPRKEMQGVRRCMEFLKISERRWALAGRLGDILRELASAGDLSIVDGDQCQENSGKKRPRDADINPPDIYPQVSPELPRSIAGTRRVSTNPPSYVSRQQERPNFSLPMNSNEPGSLPVYGQFQLSDFCLPVQPSNNFSNLIPDPMGVPTNMQYAYATHPLFEGQVMGNLVGYSQGDNSQIPSTSSNVAALSAYDVNILSGYGGMPPMDDDAMALWSAAPINLAMDDWRSYIHSFEQMTQAYGQLPTRR